MKVLTSRDFLKFSGITAAGLTLSQSRFRSHSGTAIRCRTQDRTSHQRRKGNPDHLLLLFSGVRHSGFHRSEREK